MGVQLTYDHIDISFKSRKILDVIDLIGYQDIDSAFLEYLESNKKIKYVQISEALPMEAYEKIDKILAIRNDIIFRIYNLVEYESYDISFLQNMPNLKHLQIDCYLRNNQQLIDFNILKGLDLKSLSLHAFDLKDYSFIKDLSEQVESISIIIETANGKTNFDCQWLLNYPNLKSLCLGKKVNKNIICLSQIYSLRDLILYKTNIKEFAFLDGMQIEKFELIGGLNDDLMQLRGLTNLKEIRLSGLKKLKNVDFLSELVNLEVIELKALKCVSSIPDLNGLRKLSTIVISETAIPKEILEEHIKKVVLATTET